MWSDDAEEELYSVVDVSPEIQVKLFTAENDFNPEKKMLFATYVWSGSAILAKELLVQADLINNSSVLEFGAAAGLPSIVAAKAGAAMVCSSDYPSPLVLDTLRKNIIENEVDDRVFVCDHMWGESVEPLLHLNGNSKYDIVLAAECLWKHESHEVLLKSILSVLKPGGSLLLSYSHHIPGLEDSDDRFLELCRNSNLDLVQLKTLSGKHMWSDKFIDVFFCIFKFNI